MKEADVSNSTLSPRKSQATFGTRSNVDTSALLKRDGWACAYCGRLLTLDEMTVDHVCPTLRGGPDVLDNTVVSCLSCNIKKGDMNHLEFRHWLAVRLYAFVKAPTETVEFSPVEIVIDAGENQTSTIIALPALWAGTKGLNSVDKIAWKETGAIIVSMFRNYARTDVVFLGGVLFEYLSMKYRDGETPE